MRKDDVLKVLKDVELRFSIQSDMSTFCNGYRRLKERIEEIESTGYDPLIDETECDHPFASVHTRCMGEINTCLKCGKDLGPA